MGCWANRFLCIDTGHVRGSVLDYAHVFICGTMDTRIDPWVDHGVCFLFGKTRFNQGVWRRYVRTGIVRRWGCAGFFLIFSHILSASGYCGYGVGGNAGRAVRKKFWSSKEQNDVRYAGDMDICQPERTGYGNIHHP